METEPPASKNLALIALALFVIPVAPVLGIMNRYIVSINRFRLA